MSTLLVPISSDVLSCVESMVTAMAFVMGQTANACSQRLTKKLRGQGSAVVRTTRSTVHLGAVGRIIFSEDVMKILVNVYQEGKDENLK